ELRERGTTVLLASHDLGLVRRECTYAAWLDGGHLVAYGDRDEVVEQYEEAARERARAATPAAESEGALRLGDNRVGTQEATIESVRMRSANGGDEVKSGSALLISLELATLAGPLEDPIVSVAIRRAADDVLCCELDTRMSGVSLGRVS